MKTRHALAISGLLLGYMSTASASLFIPNKGPVYFQFDNKEQVDIGLDGGGTPTNATSTCAGCSGNPEGNWGIAQLSVLREGVPVPAAALPGQLDNDIASAGTPPQFGDFLAPTSGNQITAIFYGITQNTISASGTVVSLTSSGGYIDLYYDEPGLVGGGTAAIIGTATPGGRTSDNTYTAFTDGIFLASLAFASGIDPGNPATFIQGTIDTSLTNDSGSADSYANVKDVNSDGVIDGLDGAWAATLDSDWFGTAFGTRDIRFSNKIDNNPDWNGAQGGCAAAGTGACVLGLTSNDPGRAFAVPEPATLALLGFGLLGLGARRKMKKA